MRLRQIVTYLLVFSITCASLPPESSFAHSATPPEYATSAPAEVEVDGAQGLLSNMQIAAAPLVDEFPGACTPTDRIVNNPSFGQQLWLPRAGKESSASGAANVEQSVQSALSRPDIPLDPRLVATPLEVGTTFAESVAFLYSGDNPVQRAVSPTAIDQDQVAAVSGKVLGPDGEPLAGVKVQVFGQPDLGETLSREDGLFDLVVNAGALTLCFDLPGYLPTQRKVNAVWNDFSVLDDIVLMPMDTVVSTIDLTNSSELQVARGSAKNDSSGERQATLLFEPNTGAEMVMADGSTRALNTLSVRATEFTVGEQGPQAMPGELPLASGYTYAVEFTVDEALTAGAVGVQFTKPVINYVENFLNFPPGIAVPTGYYDRGRSAWVPSNDGRVIQILAIDNGIATVDVDGSGQAANAQQLADLGIDQAEQRTLAELYSAGESLWRVPIPHFTPWDHNFPYGPPDDAYGPNGPFPRADTPQSAPCERNGSIIECENQTLGESIAIAGTPFSLNYRSSRVPGRELGSRVIIPLSASSVPASLRGIILETEIAGKQESRNFGPEPNQVYEFHWDGTDAFGRPVPTGRTLRVRLGYTFPAIYRAPGDEFERSFARFGRSEISGSRERAEITIWRSWRTVLQGHSWDARAQALGGWTLNQHHAYDIEANILHRGDGEQVNASFDGRVLRTVAGLYGVGNIIPKDGDLAVEVSIGAPSDIVAGPDGTIYFSSHPGCIYKINQQGRIYRFGAEVGNGCYYEIEGGEGIHGINPIGISLAPNGDLYVANHGSNGAGARILKFRPDGRVIVVAGNGQVGFAGDGGPATEATLWGLFDVAVAPDGSFYIADLNNQRVRHVGLDGIITTVAGGGEPADGLGDGGPAIQAKLGAVRSIAVDQNGALYIGHDQVGQFGVRVRRVGSDGIITTVAGGGNTLNAEDEVATDTYLNGVLRWLTVGPDNNLYLADGNRIRMLGQDGRMHTIVGTTDFGYSPDGTPLDEAKLAYANAAFLPNGTMYLAELNSSIIRVINPNLNNVSNDEVYVHSSQGEEIYVFDLEGRHLRTLNALTGSTLFSFGYDIEQRLLTITDMSGNITQVERNGDGTPTAITGPFGHRTLLTINEHGYLTSVTNPLIAIHSVTYQDEEGLLASFTTPNGDTNQFNYDDGGRLLRESFAGGGSWTLAQTGGATAISTTVSSELERTITLAMDASSAPLIRRSITFPDGTSTVVTSTTNGNYHTRYANGTVVESHFQPDDSSGFNQLFEESEVVLPSGLRTTLSYERHRLYNSEQDPLSGLAAMTSTTKVNGQSITSIYNGDSRTTTNTSAAGRQSTIRYDALGRVIEEVGTGLAPTFYNYNEQGLLTSVQVGSGNAARVYTIEYDNKGEATAFISPLGARNEVDVDAVGQVTSHTRPDGAITTFAYDLNGNMTSITPPGRTAHTFLYNAQNQITAYTPPDVGIGDTTTTYAYNLDGQLTNVTRPDGSSVTVSYDAAGRNSQVTLARGTIQYSYDTATGELETITAPDGGVLSYKHDGSLLTASIWSGEVAGTVLRTYDNFRRVSTLTVGSQPVSYTYDKDGMVTQAGGLRVDYGENGLPTGSLLHNISTAVTLNEFGEWSGQHTAVSGSDFYAATYTRDAVGRITRKVEAINGSSVTFDYTYNNVGRLVEVRQDNVLIATYGYDANGNRLSGPGGATGSYDAQDRMLTYDGATYSYNDAGDLKTKDDGGQITKYHYDEISNLTAVELADGRTIDYVIDGNNRRIGKKVDGQLQQGFLYQDQLRVIAELDGNNNVVSRFVYADGSTAPAYMIRSGISYRLISDHLGSVRLVVHPSTGQIVQRLDYDAFGKVLADTNPGFQPFGFAGGLYDPDTGLVRFGKRDYDAQSGRWTTKDPLGMAGGDTNLYLYVGGDPVNLTDEGGDLFFLVGMLAAILLVSLLALPVAIKIVKKYQERNKLPEEPFPLPPLPPQPCDPAPPPQPVPEPQPEPLAEPEPQADPLPEENQQQPQQESQPEPPVMQPPDYMWAQSGSPPPCPSPSIRPPVRGRLCR